MTGRQSERTGRVQEALDAANKSRGVLASRLDEIAAHPHLTRQMHLTVDTFVASIRALDAARAAHEVAFEAVRDFAELLDLGVSVREKAKAQGADPTENAPEDNCDCPGCVARREFEKFFSEKMTRQ